MASAIVAPGAAVVAIPSMGGDRIETDPGQLDPGPWLRDGSVVLSLADTPLTDDDYQHIVQCCADIATAPIEVGDMGETHALEVGRSISSASRRTAVSSERSTAFRHGISSSLTPAITMRSNSSPLTRCMVATRSPGLDGSSGLERWTR